MEFLTGSMAWFALGGAVPIIIHLLHRQRFRRVRWGAMQFLLNAIKKTQRRIRLENLLLLLIRILIMVLLALALARPFFRESPLGAFDSNTSYIFVIDNSYSMDYKRGQATSLKLAKRHAEKLLESIPFSTEDTFTLITLSEYPEKRLFSIKRKADALQAVQEIQTTDYGTSMIRTMRLIEQAVKLSENVDKRIYVFTDMQRNGWIARGKEEEARFRRSLKRLTEDRHVHVYLIDVGEEDAENTAIVGISVGRDVLTRRAKTNFTVQLYNFSDTAAEGLKLSMFVNGDKQAERPVTLDAQSMTYETFDYEFLEPGPYWIEFRTTPPAFLSKDDSRYLAVEVKEAIHVLIVDGRPGRTLEDSGTRHFQLALVQPGYEDLVPYRMDVKTPETFPADELDRFDLVVMADVPFVAPEKIERLEEFVRNGGGLFVALGPRVDREFYNRNLWKEGKGLLGAKLQDIRGHERALVETNRAEPVLLGHIRMDHPIFRVFKKSGIEDQLYQIEFCRYWGVERYDPESVLASFKDLLSSPAFLETAFGDGRVILYTSTLNRDWAFLPSRNAYVPIMVEIVRRLSSRSIHQKNVFIGDPIRFSFPAEKWKPEFRLSHVRPGTAGIVTVTTDALKEGQRRVTILYPPPLKGVSNEEDGGDLRNLGFETAGVYALEYAQPPPDEPPLSYFAVNLGPRRLDNAGLDMAEANLERISEQELRGRYPEFKFETLFQNGEAPPDKPIQAGSGLWKYILVAVLLLLVSESVLACLFGRRKE